MTSMHLFVNYNHLFAATVLFMNFSMPSSLYVHLRPNELISPSSLGFSVDRPLSLATFPDNVARGATARGYQCLP